MAVPKWELDKRVPVALIFTLVVQTAGVVFWMGQLSVRIDQLEKKVVQAGTNSNRLTRLEVHLEHIQKILQRIDKRLEKK